MILPISCFIRWHPILSILLPLLSCYSAYADEAGMVEIKLLPAERINSFTAWTNEPLFGGFQFSREPVRDESAATQTIELFKCREQKFRVLDVHGNPVTLHREVDQPRIIFGVVLQDENHSIPTDQITIIAGSVDGETRGHAELEVEHNGVFRMQTKAVAIGVLATTKDRSMAGVVVAEYPHRIMRLYLRPTKQLRGRLVDSQGKPIVGCSVDATLRVKYEPKDRDRNAYYGFDANRQTVKTDADGYYTFGGLPIVIEIALSAATAATSSHFIGIVKLQANEDHAVVTHTIEDDKKTK